jgi:hypothetical protein
MRCLQRGSQFILTTSQLEQASLSQAWDRYDRAIFLAIPVLEATTADGLTLTPALERLPAIEAPITEVRRLDASRPARRSNTMPPLKGTERNQHHLDNRPRPATVLRPGSAGARILPVDPRALEVPAYVIAACEFVNRGSEEYVLPLSPAVTPSQE